MVYKIEDVERDVRIAIDENKTSEQLISEEDIDTLSMNDIIRSKIEEAVERVHSAAPAHLLEQGHNFGDAVYWELDGNGWVLLPQDFMRLVAFRMSDWERTCHNAISVDDPLYDLQSSRHKGVRGNAQKPVCAIVPRAEGKALEFYSCKSEAAYVSRAVYMPYPKIDGDGGIDISERCYRSVVYAAASLVLLTIGEAEKSSALSEISKTALQ